MFALGEAKKARTQLGHAGWVLILFGTEGEPGLQMPSGLDRKLSNLSANKLPRALENGFNRLSFGYSQRYLSMFGFRRSLVSTLFIRMKLQREKSRREAFYTCVFVGKTHSLTLMTPEVCHFV